MSHRLLHLLQIVSLAVLAWCGFRLLGRVHPILAVVVVVIAGWNVLAVWIIRHEAAIAAAIYGKPFLRQYLKCLCWCTGDQPPLGDASDKSGSELLLRSEKDFRIAAYRAKQIVRGHDHVIDRLLPRIHEALALRTRRRDRSTQPPLASFLLVGGPGGGQAIPFCASWPSCFIATAVPWCLSADRVTPETLVGTKGAPG